MAESLLQNVTILQHDSNGSEREALIKVSPRGFHLRQPPVPYKLTSFITPDDELFQTIHMGVPVIDIDRWRLVVDGLVETKFSLNWSQLVELPKTTIVSFHECYGSPIKPPDTNLWRIGNAKWTGVALDLILRLAKPKPEAKYVWSDGLENGSFFEAKDCDRYQKDLPLEKATMSGSLVAYEMNDKPIELMRGGPVRLIVPGFYGTNSTKWLSRLSLQAKRSDSPFTTTYYNERDPNRPDTMRPCWEVEPNSFLLVVPSSEGQISDAEVKVSGRAWGANEIEKVIISTRYAMAEWTVSAEVKATARSAYEWQNFETVLHLDPGKYELMAQAVDVKGLSQPVTGRRNHAHVVEIVVL